MATESSLLRVFRGRIDDAKERHELSLRLPVADAEYLANELAELEAKLAAKWISVEEVSKLPALATAVLLGNPHWPRVCIGYLKDAATMDWVGYLDLEETLPEGEPTHFMPLPGLPDPPVQP